MQQRSRGNGWVGWLIFIFLVFGSRFVPPVANWLSQVTGLAITPPMVIAAVVGLGVLGSIVGAIGQQLGKARSASETRLPTPTMPPSSLPQQTLSAPPASRTTLPQSIELPRTQSTGTLSSTKLPKPRLPNGEQQLPSPPRFEPIIDPRVLGFGIAGLFIFGGFFLVVLLLAGGLP